MNMPTDHYDEDESITDRDSDAEVSSGGTQTLGDERTHEQMHRECTERSLDDTAQEE